MTSLVYVKTQWNTVVPPSSNSILPKEPTHPFERPSSSSNTAPTPRANGAGTGAVRFRRNLAANQKRAAFLVTTTATTSPQKPKPNAPSPTDSATKPTSPRISSRKGFAGQSKPSKAESHVSNVVRTRHNRTFLPIARSTTSGVQRFTATTFPSRPWMGASSAITSSPTTRRHRRRNTSPTRTSSFGWHTYNIETVTGISTPQCGMSK